ncbi:MAG: dienelactone hydrolase family protein [Verrucomicrobiales bacterium]|nr:dienelactone hydrolase family protein [Verrucomicrobiales bacterium]
MTRALLFLLTTSTLAAAPLPDTAPLTWDGDNAARLIDAADSYVLRQIESAQTSRQPFDTPNAARSHLAHILGVRDKRVPVIPLPSQSTALSWPVMAGLDSEGLLLVPSTPHIANAVVLPDAGQTPEQIAGLTPGIPPEKQLARILAERGYRVLVPALIDRRTTHNGITDREFLHRSAFVLGRHLVGYEIQKTLSAIDHLHHDGLPLVVAGYGTGGQIALYTSALDTRVDKTLVSGYFGDRQNLWTEPSDHNVFGLLNHFGDAELARLIAPRQLVVDPSPAPTFDYPAGNRGKPGAFHRPSPAEAGTELARANTPSAKLGTIDDIAPPKTGTVTTMTSRLPDNDARHRRLFSQVDRSNQRILTESPYTRREFFKNLDTSSPEKFAQTIEPYRTHFAEKTIGTFDLPLLAPNPRTRTIPNADGVTTYEVVLDVFPGLFAYGLLLVPDDIPSGGRRPVVVCQHGLEGRPQDTIGEASHHYYKAFATTLAQRGFITFAPQNLYIFKDRFRTLQFKANSIGKTLFSLIVPQHQQINTWLGSLPFVDPDRIAFYGLSYGGKSAMRIPPLVPGYCLSVCSADFNDWVWKNASSRSRYSYVWTGEYEIFEWDLGSTFNYAEMAALIAPRPFMVERGHFDGVAPDETVAYEFAKVRHLYAAKLKIPDKTTIEWFDGPHTINANASFDFLHRHLDWPQP